MTLTSSAFGPGAAIPTTYTQEGENTNPPLAITEVPVAAKSLTLIVDDPDAPRGTVTHWVVFNIDPHAGVILDNSVPFGGVQGRNTAESTAYRGPKPPSGTHRYFFRVFALDTKLSLPEGATRADVEGAMRGHVLTTAELMGRYTAGAAGGGIGT
jgi:hypothetical protein